MHVYTRNLNAAYSDSMGGCAVTFFKSQHHTERKKSFNFEIKIHKSQQHVYKIWPKKGFSKKICSVFIPFEIFMSIPAIFMSKAFYAQFIQRQAQKSDACIQKRIKTSESSKISSASDSSHWITPNSSPFLCFFLQRVKDNSFFIRFFPIQVSYIFFIYHLLIFMSLIDER